jgi:hypothetical protein
MRILRLGLVLVGTLVWIPYLVAKYFTDTPIPALWILAIHIPCMVGALVLRFVDWRRGRWRGRGREG